MKLRLLKLTPRQGLIVLHDVAATTSAICASFWVRFDTQAFADRIDGLLLGLPAFLIYAVIVHQVFDLHKGKWRFTSLPDLRNMFGAVNVLAVSLLALDYVLVAPNVLGA